MERRRGWTLSRVRGMLSTSVDRDAVRTHEPEAAVLVALFEEQVEARVILTRRAATLRSHRSEVSFPGGRVDQGEALVAAAMREACEEVALDPGRIEIIGSLGPLTTVSSRARITPFVGVLDERPALQGNPSEVERVFDVSLADLLADGVHRTEWWGVGPNDIEMQFFELPGDIVWGATARVLVDLLRRITGMGPLPGHWAAGRPPLG